jgi:hypothetical protein
MSSDCPRRRGRVLVGAACLVVGIVAARAALHGQAQATVYLSVIDQKGAPVIGIDASDISISEAAGRSTIQSIRPYSWPLKVTVLVDNGPRSGDALVHYRTGLQKFFAGLPPRVPVSLIATAPNPRWLVRETTDRVQIEKGIGRITPDEGLGRFGDALIEYADRLSEEFRSVSREQMQPYLPVLVSIASTHADGSLVRRQALAKMITLLRKHRVWTNLIMVSSVLNPAEPGDLPNIEANGGQNAEIAKAVQELTRGSYVPITGSGTSALSARILPELAQQITLRNVRQTMQHRIVMERAAGASGPMMNFAFALLNHPGAQFVVSNDGNIP